jgi:two-component system nitrogen regulation response regulator NtrX
MALDVLVVDDEPDIRELMAGVLGDEGYAVRTADTAERALDEVRSRTPRLVILDVWLQGSGMDGLSVLKYLKTIDPILPVIVISGHGNIETAIAAIRRGAFDFIEKPIKADRLLLVVERAIESASLRYENAALRSRAGEDEQWVGDSSAAAALRNMVEKVGPTNSRVLISGPSGVGKELAARLIHRASSRADGPFVVVNSATVAPDQMENALFGQEDPQGRTLQVGLFERAHLGTLLLDEVGDMPVGTQNKILRVLTEQRFQRVGGRHDVSVDVRVMATTTKELKAEIEKGNFREDLYYRLNVVPLRVPPLADRRDDIAALTNYFSTRIAASSGLNARSFSHEALAILQSIDWPGNVRQLRNVIERVLILSPSDASRPVSPEELPRDINGTSSFDAKSAPSASVSLSLKEAREQFEREYLTLQITRFNGNISRTAEFIGMERSALHRKLKALGISTGLRSEV